MNKTAYVAIVALGASLLANSAHAARDSLYFGVKAGKMSISEPSFSSPTNAGLNIGYAFSSQPNLAVEFEYTVTYIDGEFGRQHWDISTSAFYGVYRSSGDIYFKGKLGYLHEAINAMGYFNALDDESGISYGIGVGTHVGESSSIELEFTSIETRVDFLSIGYLYHF